MSKSRRLRYEEGEPAPAKKKIMGDTINSAVIITVTNPVSCRSRMQGTGMNGSTWRHFCVYEAPVTPVPTPLYNMVSKNAAATFSDKAATKLPNSANARPVKKYSHNSMGSTLISNSDTSLLVVSSSYECPSCLAGAVGWPFCTPNAQCMPLNQPFSHKFIVTVILLLWTSRVGGSPPHSTSRSLTYARLSPSLL